MCDVMAERRCGTHVEGGEGRGLFCGTVMGGSIDITAKKKIGLCSQYLGSDCNMRHPAKRSRNLATLRILKVPA